MIIDQLNQVSFYFGLNDRLRKALQYLQKTAPGTLPVGKHEIEGARIYALVEEFKTKPTDQGTWEAHRKYLDIHCVLQGREKIGYAPLDSVRPSTIYDAQNDIRFFEGAGDFFIAVPGMFIVMASQDAHMPGLAVQDPERIKKLVMKIEI